MHRREDRAQRLCQSASLRSRGGAPAFPPCRPPRSCARRWMAAGSGAVNDERLQRGGDRGLAMSGSGLGGPVALPGGGSQFTDVLGGARLRDPLEDVMQLGGGVDAVLAAGLQQTHQDSRGPTGLFMADEDPVLAPDCDPAQCALRAVVGDVGDAPVEQVVGQCRPDWLASITLVQRRQLELCMSQHVSCLWVSGSGSF